MVRRHAHENVIDTRKPFIRHIQKTSENDLHGLQVIVDTMKVFSKWVNWCQGDGFSSMVAQMGAIKLAMAGTIGGTDFLHCWVADSIWLECPESLITK